MPENTKKWKAPSWLTDSYLENVLRKYVNDERATITNVDIQPATSGGENYASVMSRITIGYKQEKNIKKAQELTFILKYSFESDPLISNVMLGYDIYNTEMKMYEQILPQLANILKEVDAADKLFAKTFNVDYEKSAIIFEDLSIQNYVLADRLTGLNEVHVRRALKKLAKFHAAAAVLNRRLNGELENFQRGIFNRHTRTLGVAFDNLLSACATFVLNCPELGCYYYDKLMKIKPHIVDYGTHAYSSNPEHFHTLCHGDFWINNMMMLYDDSTPKMKEVLKDVLFIDFQFCSWSSPAVDLFYFFNTSLEPKLQLDIHALNKLVQYYHGILEEVLTKFKYKGYIPTLHELHVQLEEGKILALTAVTCNQPFLINENDDPDFHCLFEDNEKSRNFLYNIYQNKRVQNNLKTLLPHFDAIGLLDVQK